MIRTVFVLLVYFATLVLPRASFAQQTIEIPVIVPLTGTGAFFGHEQQIAIEAVQETTNKNGGIRGVPVHFAIQDDQSSPQVAVQLFAALRAKQVPLVLGPSVSASCSAILPLAEANGPFVYCLANAIRPPSGSFVFSAIFSTQDMLIASLRYALARGWKRLAYIVSSDATGQDAERAIESALALPANHAIEVVAREHFAPSDVSVAAQMARIKAAAPQVLIAWTAGTPAATLFRAESDAALDVPTFTSPANLNYSQLKRESPFLPKSLYFAGSAASAPEVANTRAWRSALATFTGAVSSTDVRPDNILAGTWDPLTLLVDALRKVGPNATAEQLRQYVANTRGWTGVFGPYDFKAIPQRGIDASSVVIVSWDSAKGSWSAASRPGGLPR